MFTCFMMSAWQFLRDKIVFVLLPSVWYRKAQQNMSAMAWCYTVFFAGLQREFTVPVSEDLFIRKQAKLEQQVSAQPHALRG